MASHKYQVSVRWQGGTKGSGEVEAHGSSESFDIAVPREFNGTGDATNPEELLTSAVAACYSITLGIILENRKIPAEKIEVAAVGEMDQSGATLTFKSVSIECTVYLGASATDDQAKAASEIAVKADHYCPITNAIRDKVAVSVQPRIVRS